MNAQSTATSAERFLRLSRMAKQHESLKVRASALVGLGRSAQGSEKAALEILQDRLVNDAHYAVRAAAASGIGALQSTDGIPLLFRALHDDER
ncbi:MAG: hypothetical protein GY822_22600 [Deltaproteobacteria bacterium]|nr:hypothetical protein [Deltaproteobacteria bacterium]